ncbi:MAG: transglutaminase domain-containing protein [Phycisphaerales bacterium]|nr:MAG: transglutaminase domain-containing protein [Phycisphaerales bacterium]
MRRGALQAAVLVCWMCLPAWTEPAPKPAHPGGIDPDDPPERTFVDDWFIVRLADSDAGWAHITFRREGDRVISGITMRFTFARAGQNIQVDSTEGAVETVAGDPLSFEWTMKLAVTEMRITGTVKNGKVHISSTQFGNTTRQTHDFPAGAKMSWGVMAEQLRRGLAPGTEYDVAVYAPTLRSDGAVKAHVAVGQKEEFQALGRVSEGVKVITTLEVTGDYPLGRLETVDWVDASGHVLKSKTLLPGFGKLEMLRADEATAKAAGSEGAEVFLSTLIPVAKPIDRKAARAITYKLTIADAGGQSPPDIPATAMQTPGPWIRRSMELRVARIDHDELRSVETVRAPEMSAEFLEPNLWINSDDSDIVAMARQAAGGEKRPYAICDRLRRYVTDTISDKNLSVGFATASEVARNRQGDCSEHAVLLAALGRAVGIPSRVVYGIVYVPTFQATDNVFGFHMWVQFFIGEKWVDFDAAQGESDCNPTHIAFTTSSMKDVSMADFAFPLLRIIGQLKLEVLDVQMHQFTATE